MVDRIPGEVTFYNGDIDDGGPGTNPVILMDNGSGLSFSYPTDIAYSNAATKPATFADCTYVPASGYDPAVSFICMNPKGIFNAGSPDPSFDISFRARID